jgi:hypothetical protein
VTQQPSKPPAEKPALDEKSFQQLLSAAYVLQQHKERSQAAQPSQPSFADVVAEIVEVQATIRRDRLGVVEAADLVTRRICEITSANGAALGILDSAHQWIDYVAAAGSAAPQSGSRLPLDHSLAADCVRSGQPTQSAETAEDSRLMPLLVHSLHIRSLVVAPVSRGANVEGALELYFNAAHAFREQEVRVCQLMAALIAETLSTRPDRTSVTLQAVAEEAVQEGTNLDALNPGEKASLLASLERFQPEVNDVPQTGASSDSPASCRACNHQLAADEVFCGICGTARDVQRTWGSIWDMQRQAEASGNRRNGHHAAEASDDVLDVFPSELEDIVAKFSLEPLESDTSEFETPESQTSGSETPEDVHLPPFGDETPSPSVARRAQHSGGEPLAAFVPTDADEDFQDLPDSFHESDAPSPESYRERNSLFSWESPSSKTSAGSQAHPETAPEDEPYLPEYSSSGSLLSLSPGNGQDPHESSGVFEADSPAPDASEDSTLSADRTDWNSAAKAKGWLEELPRNRAWLARKWESHRANIYVIAAALLLLAVLLGWGTPPPLPGVDGEPAVSSRHKRTATPPPPELSFGDKLLINLGLAEAPPPPVDMGNPETKVWIDVHTALYYCPGADIYGKTPGGRVTTQHNAQEDQFQPASRQACR